MNSEFMSQVDFLAPAHQGDLVELGARLVAVGRTSITVACAIRNKTTGQDVVRVDRVVFVHIDDKGNPRPHRLSNDQ